MKKKQIVLLQKQIDKLSAEDFDLEAWKVSTQLLLTKIFGNYDEMTITIRDLKIDYSSTMLRDSNSNYHPVETCMRKGREILELAIAELELDEAFELPEALRELMARKDEAGVEKYLRAQTKGELLQLTKRLLQR